MDTQTQTGSPNPIGGVLPLATDRQFKCAESSFSAARSNPANITIDSTLDSCDGSNALVCVTLIIVFVNRTELVLIAANADLIKTLPGNRVLQCLLQAQFLRHP